MEALPSLLRDLEEGDSLEESFLIDFCTIFGHVDLRMCGRGGEKERRKKVGWYD